MIYKNKFYPICIGDHISSPNDLVYEISSYEPAVGNKEALLEGVLINGLEQSNKVYSLDPSDARIDHSMVLQYSHFRHEKMYVLLFEYIKEFNSSQLKKFSR